MAKKKVSKASKRRLMTFGIFSFIIISYFVYSLITYSFHIGKLSNEQKELEQKLDTLKGDEQELKIEIQKLRDPDYVARYARENYLYSKDGEYIIKLEPEENKEINDKQDNSRNYIIIMSLLGSIMMILVLIMKSRLNKKTAK